MSQHINPILGQYVTAKIPVKAALLQSPDLLKYASPQRQQVMPGLLSAEHFPMLMCLSYRSSLIGRPPSKGKKVYDKADLDTVKGPIHS